MPVITKKFRNELFVVPLGMCRKWQMEPKILEKRQNTSFKITAKCA